ncbi:protein of unknown function DUF322 [Beutenbergia cavernae DSM 12333]|uniref:Asp23 family protein n=1 Tax=Beutenbergia cavernae (strain ATCC BAA-8 / DSM 12333 / CCUG 43141 / JCM 11478 / NBRC 16432 / NCIMB 13614 / HKI 0122) TaxID=471853 RepID=C5C284_BEUC1|nr:Asp23/Gls24 family envelope stress response protein [Beutenbergia cavernae]ACQ81709.1 protein of unknown function DUF322 [Beutenbergia cavernae DSM 12333]
MAEKSERPTVTRAGATSPEAGTAPSDGGGTTTIADQVVTKIAGIAARNVSGVHELGGGGRFAGAIRDFVPGQENQGVSVEVGERQAAVDLDLVADYGVSIADLAQAVRRSVVSSIERMTGLGVTEVNITVHDVYIPDEEPAPAPRNQGGQRDQGGQEENTPARVQ